MSSDLICYQFSRLKVERGDFVLSKLNLEGNGAKRRTSSFEARLGSSREHLLPTANAPQCG